MLAMGLVWMLLGVGLMVRAKEGGWIEKQEENYTGTPWIRGLEAYYLKGADVLEVIFEAGDRELEGQVTVSCNRILETFDEGTLSKNEVASSLSGNQVEEPGFEGSVSGNYLEAVPVTAKGDGTYMVVFEKPGEYRVTAKNGKGEETSADVLVEQDRLAPSLTLTSAANDSGYTVVDADGIYYFRDYLQVQLSIQNEAYKGEVCSKVWLTRDGVALEVTEDTYTDILYQPGTYSYRVVDEAGNVGETSVEIMAVKSSAKPSLQVSFGTEAVCIEGQDYFQKDPNPVWEVTASPGIARVEYRIEDGTYVLLEDYITEQSCRFGEHRFYQSDGFSKKAGIEKDGMYAFTLRASDVLGNVVEKSISFCIDGTAPDTQIFVSYEADQADGVGQTGIQSFIRSAADWLFGRTSIVFDLYLKDKSVSDVPIKAVSGIDIQDLIEQITTVDGQARVRNLQVMEEDTAAFFYEGCSYQGYTHIKGILSLPAGQKGVAADCLKINRLKDRAGNIITDQGNAFRGTMMLYVDEVAPILDVDYGIGVIDEEQKRIFYQKDAVLKFFLRETFYQEFIGADGQPISPEIVVRGEEQDRAVLDIWTLANGGAVSKLTLPLSEKGQEIEYQFEASYQDGAGNSLKLGKGSEYSEYAIVLDQKAPELVVFSIEGNSRYQIDDAKVYEHKEEADVMVTLAIDDHAAYWNPDAVEIGIYHKTTKKLLQKVDKDTLIWTGEGRMHQTSFSFDGIDEESTDSYYITVHYQDRAGNLLVNRGVTEGSLNNGIYSSESFILDHQAPVFSIWYPKARRLVEKEHTDAADDQEYQVPMTGYTAYYQEEIRVCFSISEICKKTDDKEGICTGLADCQVLVKGKKKGIFVPEVIWQEEKAQIQGSFVLSEEDQYTIMVRYQDMAMNRMEAGDVQGSSTEKDVTDGVYTSTELVLDRTAPVLQCSYVDQEENVCSFFQTSENGYQYTDQPIWLKLSIEDESVRFYEIKEILKELQVTDRAAGAVIGSNLETYLEELEDTRVEYAPFSLLLPLTCEGNYEIPIGCTDLAGNQAVLQLEKVSVDCTKPQLEFSYEVETSGFLDVIRYLDLGYLFSDGKITITANSQDSISGVQTIRYTITEENGRQTVKTEQFSPSYQAASKVTLPLEAADFKGTVLVEVFDWSGNQTAQSYGHVVESAQQHKESASALITTFTAPSRTVAGVDYYNTDIKFQLAVKDHYSGLKSVSYSGGKTLQSTVDYAKQKKKEAIVYEYIEDLTLSALENNENEILVKAEYEDHTGHAGVIEQMYHIDITPPVLEVEYDQMESAEGNYYHQTRTATVTIRERNFSLEDVEFTITNSEGILPTISAFSSSGQGDDTIHTCKVVFEADGDYTFTASFVDLAGNQAEYSRVDAFTIDKTRPEMTVTYDNTQSIHDCYYADARTATIAITEHNFDVSRIEILVTTENGAPLPVISGFDSQGDSHIARIYFLEDGAYTFTISGSDRADNQMEGYTEERFLIDQTPPQLEILKVLDHSANRGVVAPMIRCQDANFDSEGVHLALEGYHNGRQKILEERTTLEDGVQIQLEDFSYTPQFDDLYVLRVIASDLAGNKQEKSITFSVNRFGSVYTFDSITEQLAGENGRYYTNQEPDIIVTETNVDTLEFQEITCNQNGKIHTMTEGVDYLLEEHNLETGWKQYVYTIGRHNFTEEGSYLLTFYSEDRAENTSDNQSKGKKIAFAIDKTSPSIVLSGIEENGQYQENNREILLDVQDNLLLQKVIVTLNETEYHYDAVELSKQDGRIRIVAGKGANWQTLCVTAFDAAGNQSSIDKIRFLVTSDLAVQFFRNPAMAGCFFGGVGIIISLGAWICTIFQRRRHHL